MNTNVVILFGVIGGGILSLLWGISTAVYKLLPKIDRQNEILKEILEESKHRKL